MDSGKEADVLINILTQPEQRLVSIHLVNFSGRTVERPVLRLPAEFLNRPLVHISPDGEASLLTAKTRDLSLPPLKIYSVLVSCDDEKKARAILKRNRGAKKEKNQPREVGLEPWQPPKPLPWLPGELISGERLVRLRAFSKAGLRRLDMDLAMMPEARVGQPEKIRLRLLALGAWSSSLVRLDRTALMFEHWPSGRKETVPIQLTFNTGATDRVLDGRVLEVEWTPGQTGIFRAYLVYRYTNQAFDGQLELDRKKSKDDGVYYLGRPLKPPVYMDGIPGFVVKVSKN